MGNIFVNVINNTSSTSRSWCKLCAGEAELMNDLESLSSALTAFDVVEPMPDDGDVTEISRQLELCVVR